MLVPEDHCTEGEIHRVTGFVTCSHLAMGLCSCRNWRTEELNTQVAVRHFFYPYLLSLSFIEINIYSLLVYMVLCPVCISPLLSLFSLNNVRFLPVNQDIVGDCHTLLYIINKCMRNE